MRHAGSRFATRMGLDPATEHNYAGHGQQVNEFTAEGEKVNEIGAGARYALTGIGTIDHAVGIAVRGSTGKVFVADSGTETVKVACKKGQVKRRGHCVKKPPKKHRRGKRGAKAEG